jgi:hypothetical protein
MNLKNDPYFPVVALAMIAALILSLVSPTPPATENPARSPAPANTLTASSAALTPAE